MAPRTLRDGTAVGMRRLLPADREGLREAYLGLSMESRYARFLTPVPRLTAAMLDRLVDRVDDVDHVARLLVALDDGEDIAVGRFVRDRDDPTRAELAVTVAESRQGSGAGSALTDGLVAEALARGVRTLTAMVHADNRAALRLMERAGTMRLVDQSHPGTVDVEVDLQAPSGILPVLLPDPPVA